MQCFVPTHVHTCAGSARCRKHASLHTCSLTCFTSFASLPSRRQSPLRLFNRFPSPLAIRRSIFGASLYAACGASCAVPPAAVEGHSCPASPRGKDAMEAVKAVEGGESSLNRPQRWGRCTSATRRVKSGHGDTSSSTARLCRTTSPNTRLRAARNPAACST